jgi:type IV pilus assembly protein PilN
MTAINLLPWRETRRKERQREYIIVAVASVAGVLLLGGLVHLQISGMIGYQERRNQYLQTEIQLLDRKLVEIKKLEETRQALIDRINVIQELQANRPGVVHLFDELVKTLPEGTYLTSLVQQGEALIFEGQAESNTRVSSYMRLIDSSEWMDAATLDVIEARDAGPVRISSFKLNAKQTIPGLPADESALPQADGAP